MGVPCGGAIGLDFIVGYTLKQIPVKGQNNYMPLKKNHFQSACQSSLLKCATLVPCWLSFVQSSKSTENKLLNYFVSSLIGFKVDV